METAKPVTVYYDGACPVCTREIGVYRACAGAEHVVWVNVGAPDMGERAAPDLTRADALARFHVRDADGQLVSGAQAFAALWLVLPAWRWLGYVARMPVIAPFLELFYRCFLRLRIWRRPRDAGSAGGNRLS
jgi:predicted DCC family thiol-disulfide oxidoreductase YuxK